jgi:hypothetical protein
MKMRVPPEAVAEIHRLSEQNDGLCVPEHVVRRAQNKNSALHELFEWDDKKAGHQHRLEQARALIMSVQVTYVHDGKPIVHRVFVSLADDRIEGKGYRTIEAVMKDPSKRAQLLSTALAELGALKKRYGRLKELTRVFTALDKVKREHGE